MGVRRRRLPYAVYVEAKDRKKKIWEQEIVWGEGREMEGKRKEKGKGGTSEEEEVYRRKQERKEEKRAQELLSHSDFMATWR